jgi:hypothetical protein
MTFNLYQWEPVADLFNDTETRDLVREQWEELALNRHIPLAVDVGRLAALERQGLYRIWTMRRDGLLVGFIEFTLTSPLHHAKTLYAFDGGHFIHPEFRNPFLWCRMWRKALDALAGIGVKMVIAHDNPLRPMTPAFHRLGFWPAGRMYAKEL